MPTDRRLLTTALPALALALVACFDAGPVTAGERAAARPASTVLARRTPAAPDADSPSLYDLPSAWRDQRGDTLRLAALAGKVRVVAMVYTSCAATCPLILADLKRVEAAVPAARRDDVGLVLVSLDPARDTPGRLAEWGRGAALDPARWTLLAGDDDAVREVAAAIGVRYQPLAGGEMAHTNAITVLDRAGRPVHQQTGLGEGVPATTTAVLGLLR